MGRVNETIFWIRKNKRWEINILEDFYLNLLNNIENNSINIEEFGYVIIKEAKYLTNIIILWYNKIY